MNVRDQFLGLAQRLQKSAPRAGHKYVRREGGPGNYTYWYRNEKTGEVTSSKDPKGGKPAAAPPPSRSAATPDADKPAAAGKPAPTTKRSAGDTGDPDRDVPKDIGGGKDKPGKTTGPPPPPAPGTEEFKRVDAENLAEAAKNPLARYRMEVVGKDKKNIADIAQKLSDGIDKASDFCQVRPAACAGNLGIPRSDMPQIMDEPLSKLKGTDEQWKYDAAAAAGADPSNPASPFDQMLAKFKEDGVKVKTGGTARVGDLKATQSEIKAKKAAFFADRHLQGTWPPNKDGKQAKCDLSKKPIVVSKDGFILDGHHRYAALLMIGPERTMSTIEVDLPMHEILSRAMDMPGIFRADVQDNVISSKDKPDFKGYADKADKAARAAAKSWGVWGHHDAMQKALDAFKARPGDRTELRAAMTALEVPGCDWQAIARNARLL